MRSLHAILASLLLLASPLAAQQPGQAGQQVSARDLERVAYSLRRLGKFPAAGAAYEQLLEALPRGPEKRLVGAEAAELFRVSGRLDRALMLYRRNHDFTGEFEVLFELGRIDEALTVARLVKYPKGEAEALGRLGRVDEALRLYAQHRLRRERAELLASSGRNAEAARAFVELRDFYAQAQALEAMGDANGARRAYQDATIQLTDDLRHEWLPRLQQAEEILRRAPDAISRERARLRLARVLGQVSEQYERLAVVYARTGQPADKTVQLAQNAKRFVERQRDTLLDAGSSVPDKYGEQAVKYHRLPERIAALERACQDYARSAPPPATPPRR